MSVKPFTKLLLVLAASTASNTLLAQTAAPVTQLGEVVVDAAKGAQDPNQQPPEVTALPGTGPVVGYDPQDAYTATKTGAPILRTPQSVSVVGSQQIRDLNAQSVVQATEYVSGVLPSTFGFNPDNDFYLIRGFPGQQSGYFLDGLQLYSNAFATFRVEPFGLERIEVLEGPASVLYGGSNVGGIIDAVSKVPPSTPYAYVESGFNNYGNAYGAFDVGGPVSKDPQNTLFYRLEGLIRGGGTQVNFTNDDRKFIAPSFAWRPDLDTTVTVLGQFQKDNTNTVNFLPYVGTVVPAPFGRISSSLFTSDPGIDTFQRDQNLIGYQISHRFNDTFTARQNFRFSDLRVDEQTLYGIGYANAATGDLYRFNYTTTPHVTEVALDNQLEGHFKTGDLYHTTLLGLDYKHYTLLDQQGFVFSLGDTFNLLNPRYFIGTAPAPNTNYLNNFNVQDQVGVYAQESAKYGPFTLVLSGRHDTLESSLTNMNTPSASVEAQRNAFTGRVGLIYTAPFGLAPYATYATSFDPQLGTNSATGGLLAPTTGQLTEVGVKYQPTFAHLLFTGSLFNLVQQNVLTTNPANVQEVIQTGEERSRGFEAQITGYIVPGLKVVGSYTGYNIRDTRDLNTALVGKVPVGVPQNFGAAFIDYTIQNGPLKGLGGGAGPRFVGGSFADTANVYGIPGYVFADANLHYEVGDHWRAALNVRNVFDQLHVATCSTINACFYDIRRTATFSVAYKF